VKNIIALLLIVSFLCISGCETFRGFGKDVEKAGNWVQKKAKD
jgi:predicted small secreted protein